MDRGSLTTEVSDAGGFTNGKAWLLDGDRKLRFFDPETAEWTTPQGTFEMVDGDPVTLPGWDAEVHATAGWTHGPSAVALTPRSGDAPRLLVHSTDGGWAPAGCTEEPAHPFVTPDRTWVAVQDDEQGARVVEVVDAPPSDTVGP
jgi:hypothetical protein